MVLDLDSFRHEKGGDPEKIRENQRKRYKKPELVDAVVEIDAQWRRLRFQSDQWNKVKKMASKTVGEKMKAKEPVGDPAADIPERVVEGLESATPEVLRTLTVAQLKKVSALIDVAAKKNEEEMEKCELARHKQLFEIGNVLHPSGKTGRGRAGQWWGKRQ